MKEIKRGKAELLPHQIELVQDRISPIRVFAGGYRSGKTVGGVAAVHDMGTRAGGYPILVIEPTYRMIVDVFVATAQRMFKLWNMPFRWYKTDKILVVGKKKNNYEIWCRSGDNRDSIEGITAGGALIDEWELIDIDVLKAVMARVSMGPCQQILFTGTPEGYGPAWQWLLENPDPNIRQWSVSTTANTTLSSTYVKNMSARLDDDEQEEKLNGNRSAKGGRVYKRFNRAHHAQEPFVKAGTGRIVVACDFNVSYMHWILLEVDDDRKKAHVFDEVICTSGTTTDEHAERCAKRIAEYLSKTHNRHFTREDIYAMKLKAFHDASGGSRKTSSAFTDKMLLIQAGFNAISGLSNPPVMDRINSVNVLLRENRLSFDATKCKVLVRALETQAYDADKNNEPEKRQNIDHGVDALGYFVWWQWPVHAPKANQVERTPLLVDKWGML